MEESIDRNWHPDFREYTEMMVNHPNYKGLYFERDKEGRVKWVVTGKSEKGQLRQTWWDDQWSDVTDKITKVVFDKTFAD